MTQSEQTFLFKTKQNQKNPLKNTKTNKKNEYIVRALTEFIIALASN